MADDPDAPPAVVARPEPRVGEMPCIFDCGGTSVAKVPLGAGMSAYLCGEHRDAGAIPAGSVVIGGMSGSMSRVEVCRDVVTKAATIAADAWSLGVDDITAQKVRAGGPWLPLVHEVRDGIPIVPASKVRKHWTSFISPSAFRVPERRMYYPVFYSDDDFEARGMTALQIGVGSDVRDFDPALGYDHPVTGIMPEIEVADGHYRQTGNIAGYRAAVMWFLDPLKMLAGPGDLLTVRARFAKKVDQRVMVQFVAIMPTEDVE